MNWITDNAIWVAAGLLLFFGAFVIAFVLRNKSAKTDDTLTQTRQRDERNLSLQENRKH